MQSHRASCKKADSAIFFIGAENPDAGGDDVALGI
jgi:hypothetical protein